MSNPRGSCPNTTNTCLAYSPTKLAHVDDEHLLRSVNRTCIIVDVIVLAVVMMVVISVVVVVVPAVVFVV